MLQVVVQHTIAEPPRVKVWREMAEHRCNGGTISMVICCLVVVMGSHAGIFEDLWLNIFV